MFADCGPRTAGCRSLMQSANICFLSLYARIRYASGQVYARVGLDTTETEKVLLCSGNGIPAILSRTAALLTEPPDLQCSTELIRVPSPFPFCKAVLLATYDCTKAITLVCYPVQVIHT
jgi:hypothetical protein